MVTISKVGDSTIKFEFTNNDHYLYNNGEISVPLNSLILVTDDTDLVVFKKIDGDVFVTFLIGNSNFSSKDELVAWYKENMVDGGGSDITSGDVQNMIDASISGKADSSAVTEEISAAVSGKQDTLIAGENITISGNVISAEGGGKAIEAGRGISITTGETADTVSFNLPLSASSMMTDSVVGGYFGNTSMAQYGFAFGENANCGNSGYACIALGRNVTANGVGALALGCDNTAKKTSVAIGKNISTNIDGEIGVGQYNVSSSGSSTFGDSGNTLFSVGNGTSNNARHNAFEIRQNGDIYITSGNTDIKLQDNLGGGGNNVVELTQAEYDALVESGTVDPSAFYIITDAVAFDPSTKVDTSAFTAYSAATDATLSGKADTSAVTESINAAVSGKQDTLSAGTGIDITDNVISATGGGGKAIEAGRGISVTTGETADTVSLDLKVYSNSNDDVICNTNDNTFSGKHSRNFICGWGHSISGNSLSQIHYNAVFGVSNTVANSSLVNDKGFSGVFGQYNYVNASYALVSGLENKINNDYEFASGAYNNSNTGSTDADKTLYSVGNGTSNNARHNAFEIRKNGDIYITSGGTDIKLQDNLGGGEVSSAITSGDTNAVAGGAVYDKIDEVEQVTAAALNNLNDKFGGLSLVKLTQSAYDALSPNYDNNTLYVIV